MNAVLLMNKPPATDGERPGTGEACFENIGPRERALRARFGYVALAAGVVLAAALVALDAAWWWRLLVVFPFGTAAANWLQARERT